MIHVPTLGPAPIRKSRIAVDSLLVCRPWAGVPDNEIPECSRGCKHLKGLSKIWGNNNVKECVAHSEKGYGVYQVSKFHIQKEISRVPGTLAVRRKNGSLLEFRNLSPTAVGKPEPCKLGTVEFELREPLESQNLNLEAPGIVDKHDSR